VSLTVIRKKTWKWEQWDSNTYAVVLLPRPTVT